MSQKMLLSAAILLVLSLPCSANAQPYYAQSVDNYSSGVRNPDGALGDAEGSGAELDPQSWIELDMNALFGDDCSQWDISIYNFGATIKVELANTGGVWEIADLSWSQHLADKAGWAGCNVGERWRHIRIKNIDDGAVCTLSAVQSIVVPATSSSPASSSAAEAAADPYPEDRCDCGSGGSVQAPLLGPTAMVLLLAALLLIGGLVIRSRKVSESI